MVGPLRWQTLVNRDAGAWVNSTDVRERDCEVGFFDLRSDWVGMKAEKFHP
jgi:hypothetical protein